MADLLLNEYGVVDGGLLFFIFCFFVGIPYIFMLLLAIYFFGKYFPKISNITAAIFSIGGAIGLAVICVYAHIKIPGPLEIAERYANETQKAKLRKCLREDLGWNEFSNSMYKPILSSKKTVGKGIYLCKTGKTGQKEGFVRKNKKEEYMRNNEILNKF